MNMEMNLLLYKTGNFLSNWVIISCARRNLYHGASS